MTRDRRPSVLLASLLASGAVVVPAGFALAGGSGARPAALTAVDAARFTAGVAAGEPRTDRVTLWTRVDRQALLELVVARDRALRRARRIRLVRATSAHDFTAQVTVRGLNPGTRYWYRFRAGRSRSPLGTFVTAPSRAAAKTVRFAWTGDFDATATPGQTRPYWNDLRIFSAMARERNDFNIALGDTIYSDSEVPGALRPIALTVAQKWAKYRRNLAQAPLRRLRATAALFSHWDDHEFVNDFSPFERSFSNGVQIDGRLLYQRGLRAFRDYAPVAYSRRLGIYRSVRWGRNLELFFLDERSFRSAKASAGGVCDNPQTGAPDLAPTAPADKRALFAALVPSLAAPVAQRCLDTIRSPQRTMLGRAQREQFLRDLRRSTARFKVIVNEVPMQQFYALPYDRWEGYEAERRALLREIARVPGTVVITTDVHAVLAGDVRYRTLESGGPQPSGLLEVTVGPAATANFGLEIDTAVGRPNAGRLVDDVFFEPPPPNGVGMRCSVIDRFSYGEVSVGARELRIVPKDDRGRPLREEDGKPCGPFVVRR
ncbi:alkaline phosphatase D family protein [Thermoleophilum album]|uniref:alkaline phosphatase D family protein n=1 Tax=Thermoleophilum album TaxID=29539 RepID=UPI000B879EF0|nr:alkaline phosphatase D family protein [Thermoleophilum album]